MSFLLHSTDLRPRLSMGSRKEVLLQAQKGGSLPAWPERGCYEVVPESFCGLFGDSNRNIYHILYNQAMASPHVHEYNATGVTCISGYDEVSHVPLHIH